MFTRHNAQEPLLVEGYLMLEKEEVKIIIIMIEAD